MRHHANGERLLIGLPAALGVLLENRCPFRKDNGRRILNSEGQFAQLKIDESDKGKFSISD